MNAALVRYDAMCSAIASAYAVDELSVPPEIKEVQQMTELRRRRSTLVFPYVCPQCDYEVLLTEKANEHGPPVCPIHNERLVPVDYDAS